MALNYCCVLLSKAFESFEEKDSKLDLLNNEPQFLLKSSINVTI